jgi:hypothetical protein
VGNILAGLREDLIPAGFFVGLTKRQVYVRMKESNLAVSRESNLPYYYYAFGLNIASEIECPQLPAGPGSPADLTIRYGRAASESEQADELVTGRQVSAGCFLLNVNRTARYLIRDGNEITIQPYPNANQDSVRLYLLGSVFGALLHQRGFWPLHGSGIVTSHGAAIFAGASGIGKSSLAGAFQRRGYQTLADDVCAVSVNSEGIAQVWPAYPRIHLWADAVVKLGDEPGNFHRAHNKRDKYELPVQNFSMDPVAIFAVYAIYIGQEEGICATPLKGFDKVQELTANTYRLQYLNAMHLEQQHFQQTQILARQARVVRVTRPQQPFLLEEMADLIEKDFYP